MKAAKAVTTKAVSFISGAGPILSTIFGFGLSKLEEHYKGEGMREQDIECGVASYKFRLQDMLKEAQGEIAAILARDGLSPKEQFKEILELSGMEKNCENTEQHEIGQGEEGNIEDHDPADDEDGILTLDQVFNADAEETMTLDQALDQADKGRGDSGQNSESGFKMGSEENLNVSSRIMREFS